MLNFVYLFNEMTKNMFLKQCLGQMDEEMFLFVI